MKKEPTIDEIMAALAAGQPLPQTQDVREPVGELISHLADDLRDVLSALPNSRAELDAIVEEARTQAAEIARRVSADQLQMERVRSELLRALEESRAREVSIDSLVASSSRDLTARLSTLADAVDAAVASTEATAKALVERVASLEKVANDRSAAIEAQRAVEQVGRDLEAIRDDLISKLESTNTRISKVFVSPPPSSIQVKKDGVKVGERRAVNFIGSAVAVTVTDSRDGVDVTFSTPNAMGVAVHGSTSGYARPSGYTSVHWIGSVEPSNATDNDLWSSTA